MKKQGWKRCTAAALAMGLFCTAVPVAGAAGLDSFTRTDSYQNGMFTDVPANAWYAENVAAAYELDLMKGSSSTQFSPLDNLTVAEMLTIACRIHAIYYTGKAEFPQSTPWYQVYVDYATENGLIAPGQFADWEANATRAQFAAVMANAVPEEALPAINTIPDGQIPDVPAGSLGYDAIYCLYRAGVLVGNDAAGTFTPNASIQRNEVAALVTRIAEPELRQSVSLQQSEPLNTDVYWRNSIQAPNIFEFRADGTVVHYFMEPGQAIRPEALELYRTGRYQLNGNKLTLTWGDWRQTLEMVTPESLKAKGFSMSDISETVPSGTKFFYDTAFVETDMPEQANYMVPTDVKVAAPSSNLYSGDRLTVTGTLNKINYTAPNGTANSAYILELSQPQTWTMYDESILGPEAVKKTIDQIQVSFAQGDMESLVGKQVTVSGEVMFGHTAYHLTTIVLMNSIVG
ncbi:MAG: S-layer homology domain-containing protein [Butyricicoccus sp.]|nr:S-layer homology domain-containing protein [Butyricicoccus sp.]